MISWPPRTRRVAPILLQPRATRSTREDHKSTDYKYHLGNGLDGRHLDPADLETLPVHGPNGRIHFARQALGLRQVDFARVIRELGGRASRETVSHWENLDTCGRPRSRVTRRNARIVAQLVRQRLRLPVGDELFFEPQETAWDAALREQTEMSARMRQLEQRIAELEGGLAGRLLNGHEVATFLGISLPTVRDWAHAGELPSFKLSNGVIRFRGEEIESWLERKRKAPPAPQARTHA